MNSVIIAVTVLLLDNVVRMSANWPTSCWLNQHWSSFTSKYFDVIIFINNQMFITSNHLYRDILAREITQIVYLVTKPGSIWNTHFTTRLPGCSLCDYWSVYRLVINISRKFISILIWSTLKCCCGSVRKVMICIITAKRIVVCWYTFMTLVGLCMQFSGGISLGQEICFEDDHMKIFV